MNDDRKPIPRSIVVFGAAGRLGGPVARYVSAHAPAVRLRLVTSQQQKQDALRKAFPAAEIVVANYLDAASMQAALAGIEAVFLVTPNFLDEAAAMEIFAHTVHEAGTVRHIVRLLGDAPGMTLERVPAELHGPGGPATQHLIAKRTLDAARLPITYINIAAYLLDNFINIGQAIREKRTLINPSDRLMAFVDPRDVAEVAARILLSPNHRHIGQYYCIDNGHDVMRFSDVAAIMSEVLGVRITHDGAGETFVRELGPGYNRKMGNPHAAEYFVRYFEFEYEIETVWRRTDFAETILGRKPKTLRAWLEEHRTVLMPTARD